MNEIEIGMLEAAELPAAIAVLARGLRDNPLPTALFGSEPDRREQALVRLYDDAATALDWQRHLLIARGADGAIVGVCGMMPPGEECRGMGNRLRLLRGILRDSSRSSMPAGRALDERTMPASSRCHWRLGPLAVAPALQGTGIGAALLRVACAQIDAVGDDLYLETDSHATFGFFAHFGFIVIGERHILNVPTWRMLRRPEPGHVGRVARSLPGPR